MTRGVVLWAIALLAFAATTAAGAIDDEPEVKLGARLEYSLTLDDESTPYPYNLATRSVYDRTRMMFYFRALGTRYGSFFVKGQALWDDVRPEEFDKRFLLEQGDYLWQDEWRPMFYWVRVFANERRFITYDMIAPLLDDDVVAVGTANRGVRFDGAISESVEIIALYSRLQATLDEWRDLAYLRGAYFVKSIMFSASYLYEDGALEGSPNHAVVKVEANASYKQLFATVSYEQSESGESGFIVPGGSWGSGSPSEALPDNAALFAEARLTRIPMGSAGSLRLVWKYGYEGENYVNALTRGESARLRQSAGLYYMGGRHSLFARLLYVEGERWDLESEDERRVALDVWGNLANGFDFFARSAIEETNDQFEEKGNFVHLATHHRSTKTMAGGHVMWRNLETPYSETMFGIDGRIVISPNWAFYWRFLAGDDFAVSENTFSRLEYRPNNRLFATLSFGRWVVGDDPFMLEDRQFELGGSNAPIFTLFLRGDF